MSNRDMIKLARLMKKQSAKEKTKKRSLEIKEKTNYTVEEDAKRTDSIYWDTIRPVPLTNAEIEGYEARDSILLAKSDTSSGDDTLKKQKSKLIKFAGSLISGKTYQSKDSGLVFRYNGLIGLDKIGFNTVDGFTYKQKFSLIKKFSPGKQLMIQPEFGYAFNRKSFIWNIHNSLNYAPLRRAELFVNIGERSSDFNKHYGINRKLNSYSSLFFRTNYLRLYRERYIRAGNKIDVANGLQLSASITYEERTHMENSTDYSFFFKDKRDYSPNIPENIHLIDFPLTDHESFIVNVGLSYTPRYFYRIEKGVKKMAGSAYPTFRLEYKKGINGTFGSDTDFDFLEFKIFQDKDLEFFSSLKWSLGTGIFINNKNLYFPDFKHFNTQKIPVLLNRPDNAFMLLEYYMHSTPDWFVEAHIKYNTPFLLLKLLPVISETLWQESLYCNYLYQPELDNWIELGYGLTDISFIADAGIFVGFQNANFSRWGFKVSLNL